MEIKRMTTYNDIFDRPVELTQEEINWFESEVKLAKEATGLQATIIPFDHDLYKGELKEAMGITSTSKPECAYEDPDTIITIDTYYIHEQYGVAFNGDHNLSSNGFREVMAHELAHLFVWDHSENHKALTQKYLDLIERKAS